MAAPAGSPQLGFYRLEREDRAAKVRTASSYVSGILLLLTLMLVLQGVATGGFSIDPFHLPLGSFLPLLLTLLLLINAVTIALACIELRLTRDTKHRVWRAEDFMTNARPLIVAPLILAIFFSNSTLINALESFSTNEGEEAIEYGSDYSVRFYPSDIFDTSHVSTLEASSAGGPFRVFLLEERDYGLLTEADYDPMNLSLGLRAKWLNTTDASSYIIDIQGLALDYRDHALVLYNPGNSTITVTYRLANEANRALLNQFVMMCLAFFGLNLAWAVAVFALKRRYIKEFIKTEQQRLMRTYTIEEVFLIYRDGRLICHNTRRLKPDIDKDVLTGMLTAVQTFVKDSFAHEEKSGALNQLHYGKLKILIENGPRANLAVVVSGTEPASLRPNMKAMLDGIHTRYMSVLDDWDGDVSRLRELKKQIGLLIPEERIRPRTIVEEILLMHRDNRFMMHLSQRGQPDVDDTLLNTLLETVRSRVGEAMQSPERPSVYEIPYGDWKVLIEYGVHTYLAVLISGPEPPDLRQRMRSALSGICSAFGDELAKWDGSSELVLDLKPFIDELFVESLKKKRRKWL